MSIRKLSFMVVFLGMFCLFASAAHAQDCGEHCVQYPEDGFTGWENLDSVGYGPPSPTACHAYSSIGQRCRECAEAYDNNGNSKGYKVCAYVSKAASCECVGALTANCTVNGTCTYGT